MQTKEFHLGDVLSITTGRLVSPRHIDGVYDILNFMTGDDLFTRQLPRASEECKPYLIKQFPKLATPEMDLAITELDEMLRTKNENTEAKKIVIDWLAKQAAKYGETFIVEPLSMGAHQYKNPIAELMEMTGGKKKIVIIKTKQTKTD